MKNTQKGFIIPLLILIIVLVAGFLIYKKTNTDKTVVTETETSTQTQTNPATTSTPQKVGVKAYSNSNISFEYPATFTLKESEGSGVKGVQEQITVSNGNTKFDITNFPAGFIDWDVYKTQTVGEYKVEYLKSNGNHDAKILVLAQKGGAQYRVQIPAMAESEVNAPEFTAALNTILLTLKQ